MSTSFADNFYFLIQKPYHCVINWCNFFFVSISATVMHNVLCRFSTVVFSRDMPHFIYTADDHPFNIDFKIFASANECVALIKLKILERESVCVCVCGKLPVHCSCHENPIEFINIESFITFMV